jgi:hypothetical protein
MKAMISETTNGVDKVKRYGWITKDKPGVLMTLHKDKLQIHPSYQRDVIPTKVKEITANWSWVGAGAIVVGERGGEYWVIDGQHRVLAAKRRSDITHLPCVIFQTEGVKQEAAAFLDLNTGRKPVSSIGKFKAMIAAGDEAACTVHKTLEELGVTPKSTAIKGRELKSVAWAVRKAGEDADKFKLVMRIAADLSHDMPIQERLLDGLWYINERLPGGIINQRFNDRLRAVGAKRLIDGANKASAYFVRGGANIWATGMMDEINKGLRNKFALRDAAP